MNDVSFLNLLKSIFFFSFSFHRCRKSSAHVLRPVAPSRFAKQELNQSISKSINQLITQINQNQITMHKFFDCVNVRYPWSIDFFWYFTIATPCCFEYIKIWLIFPYFVSYFILGGNFYRLKKLLREDPLSN